MGNKVQWYNKETGERVEKSESWNNPKDNFSLTQDPEQAWEEAMEEARINIMVDEIEYLWDGVGIDKAPQEVKDRYTAKKDVRNSIF